MKSALRHQKRWSTTFVASFISFLGLTAPVVAQQAPPSFVFTTIAGQAGVSGKADGTGSNARFNRPSAIAVDSANNIYVTDSDNFAVRKISPTGVVTTLAGRPGESGNTDATSAFATFGKLSSIAVDSLGSVYVGDSWARSVRKISTAGVVSTVAGGPDPAANYRDWLFGPPVALALDVTGNLYLVDGATVRAIGSDGAVTIIGNPLYQSAHSFLGLAVGSEGDIFVTDGFQFTIWKLNSTGGFTTLAGGEPGNRDGTGTAAQFAAPAGLVRDSSGNLYVLDRGSVRAVSAGGLVTTVAGSPHEGGSADGLGGIARFAEPLGIAMDSRGNIYIADTNNHTIRKGTPTSVLSPPIITERPYDQNSNVAATTNVTFQSGAAGASLTFRWMKDGVVLPNEKSTALTISNVRKSDSGTYSVIVTNPAGSATLEAGTLSVYAPPVTSFTSVRQKDNGSFLWGIAAGAGKIVTVGTHGTVLVSTDGLTWTSHDSGTTDWLTGVTYGAGKFVAVGDQGRILNSTDGIHWMDAATSGTANRLNNVVWGHGLFVAVGENGTIVTSPDADTWTPRISGVTGWLRGLASKAGLPNERFVASGQGGTILGSDDGIIWNVQRSGGNDLEAMASTDSFGSYVGVGHEQAVEVADMVFVRDLVAGVVQSSIMYFWRLRPTGAPGRLRGLAMGANALFATGENGLILSAPSIEGPWALISSGTTANLVSGVFVGNTLYIVGQSETILRSTPLYTSRLVNISSRGFAGSEASTLISGFVIQGSTPKKVLLRAIGPELSRTFGLSGVILNPVITLFDAAGVALDTNTGWGNADNVAEIRATAVQVGAFPLQENSADSALVVTLNPGIYTTQISGLNGSTGLSMIEAYDAEPISNSGARAINISTRARVAPGQNTLIAGFVIDGDSARRVLIRAAGPELNSQFGLSEALTDPKLTLYNASGHVLQTASAWYAQPNADEIRDASGRSGAFAFAENGKDSAMVITLLPGVYTVQVEGANDASGIALIEVYDLP